MPPVVVIIVELPQFLVRCRGFDHRSIALAAMPRSPEKEKLLRFLRRSAMSASNLQRGECDKDAMSAVTRTLLRIAKVAGEEALLDAEIVPAWLTTELVLELYDDILIKRFPSALAAVGCLERYRKRKNDEEIKKERKLQRASTIFWEDH